jgi:fluoride exporter
MRMYLWVALGSALGGAARYGGVWLTGDLIGDAFPWGTILVNVTGSFVIGFYATVTGPDGRFLVGSEQRVFVMVGVCGGYTTFSAFSLQVFEQLRHGQMLAAAANSVLSMALCLLAVWLGHASAAAVNRPATGRRRP